MFCTFYPFSINTIITNNVLCTAYDATSYNKKNNAVVYSINDLQRYALVGI